MALVLTPGHVEPFSREHAWYAILGEGFVMGKQGYTMNAPSLGFGIAEASGLVLGQDCGRAVQGM